jgi:hypothetical protein
VPRLEIVMRLLLIAGLCAAIWSGVTVWLEVPLALVAITATTELAIRPYTANAADRLLLGCGAIVAALIIIGLGLNLTPWGLTKTTWNIAWLVLSIGVLARRRGLSTGFGWPLPQARALSGWLAAAALVIAVAVTVSVVGVQRWDQKPLLAFSVVSESTNSVVVEIEATSMSGTYRITAMAPPSNETSYQSAPFTVNAASGSEQLRERVPIDVPGKTWKINLVLVSNGSISRWLRVIPR